MIEPSNAEQATWSDVTRDYVRDLQIENERLRALVEDAYYEGNDDAVHGYGRDWLGSDSYAALQPKEAP